MRIDVSLSQARLFGIFRKGDLVPLYFYKYPDRCAIEIFIKSIEQKQDQIIIEIELLNLTKDIQEKRLTYDEKGLSPYEATFIGWCFVLLNDPIRKGKTKQKVNYEEKAAKFLTYAIENGVESCIPYYLLTEHNLGNWSVEKKQFELYKASKMIDVFPDVFQLLWRREENEIRRIGFIEEGLQKFPHNIELVHIYTSYLRNEEKFQELLDFLQKSEPINDIEQAHWFDVGAIKFSRFESLLKLARFDEAEKFLDESGFSSSKHNFLKGLLYFEKKDYEQAAEFFNETVKKSVPLREDDIKDASSYYLLSCYQRENNISKMEEMLNFLPLPVEPIGIDEFCFDYDDIVEKTLQGMLNSKVNELTKAKAKGILAYLIKEKRLPNIEKREIDRKFTSKELKDLNYGLQLIQDCLEYYPDNNTFNGVYSDLLYLKKDYDNSFIYKIKTLANRSKEEYLCSVYLTECSDKFLDNYVSHIKQELENIYNAEEEYIKYDFSGDLQSLFERKKYRTIDNLFKWLEDKLDLEKVEKEYKSYYGGGLFEIAYSSEEVGNINRAKYLYEKYLEINGESSSVLNNLAIIYEQQGNLKRAKKFIKRAKQLTKGNDETINRNFTRIFAKTKTKKEKKISEESEPSAISKENVSRKKIRTLVKFPTPSGATWDMVSIQFVSDDSVKISVKSIHKRYTFAEIGFKDHRKGDLPDSQWELLKYLAKKNGELSWQKDSAKPNVQKRIQELRKRLKFLMGIDDDPFFPYRQYKAYKTKFLIEDKSYSSTEQEPPVESNF